jgi:predicted RNA-binding protein with PIN domain
MTIVIDGYNLLHASDVFGGSGPDSFAQSRTALLNLLARLLTEKEASGTLVVFDAADAPPGLPQIVQHRGITARFAANHADADTLIEELIESESQPRRLTVVSSDHRLHRAARRRKSTCVDSDQWLAELYQRRESTRPAAASSAKPQEQPTSQEVDYWLEKFTEPETPDKLPENGIFPPGYGEDLLDDE